MCADNVILAYRAFDSQSMLRHIPGQRTVCEINIRVSTGVLENRNLHRRYNERPDPPMVRTVPMQGMKIVAIPSASANKALEKIPPAGPASFRCCAASVPRSSPSAP